MGLMYNLIYGHHSEGNDLGGMFSTRFDVNKGWNVLLKCTDDPMSYLQNIQSLYVHVSTPMNSIINVSNSVYVDYCKDIHMAAHIPVIWRQL